MMEKYPTSDLWKQKEGSLQECFASNVKRKQMQLDYISAAVFSTNFEKAGQEETHSLISGTALPWRKAK